MKIHVASFFEEKNHKGRLLSIAVSQPKAFKDIGVVSCLLPSWSLVSKYKTGKIDKQEYIRTYEKDVLKHLTPYKLRHHIISAAEKDVKEVTLLCWEKEGEFCHRQLVYRWLRKWIEEKITPHGTINFITLGEMH